MRVIEREVPVVPVRGTPANALDVLARRSDHPSAFLALNRETRHFAREGLDGLVAYRASGGWLFQLGGPFAAPGERRELLDGFRAFARSERKKICALQIRPEDVPLYRDAGFRVNQLGLSYTLDLRRFKTSGTRFMQLRNKINRARRAGVVVEEVGVERPRTDGLAEELEALTAAWLSSKGRFKKLLEFMIGELGGPHDVHRRTFVASAGGRIVGFVTYVPVWGRHAGLMHDLCRRAPDAPPGVMELVNATAIERFRSEGHDTLSFGLTPLVGIDDAHDRFEGRSRIVSWLLRKLAVHGKAIYPAQSQAQYKMKWQPDVIVPEYFAFEGRFRLGCLLRLLILTRSV